MGGKKVTERWALCLWCWSCFAEHVLVVVSVWVLLSGLAWREKSRGNSIGGTSSGKLWAGTVPVTWNSPNGFGKEHDIPGVWS